MLIGWAVNVNLLITTTFIPCWQLLIIKIYEIMTINKWLIAYHCYPFHLKNKQP